MGSDGRRSERVKGARLLRLSRALALLGCGAAIAGAPSAHALCTAAQIGMLEAACPVASTMCFISEHHTIEDGCTLDFGNRDVTFLTNGGLTIGSRTATLRAGSVTVGGGIDGRF